MASKLERERMALETAETELKERRRNLVQLEREETDKAIAKAVKKLGPNNALAIMEMAQKHGAKKAKELLSNDAVVA